MRVLFAAIAEKTHFLGMAPLAWALRTAGHDVRVASQPEMTDVITGAGLTAVPVGKDHKLYEISRLEKRLEIDVPMFDMAENRPEKLTWDYLRPGYDQVVRWWFRVVNDSMVADLVDLCRQWRPDLVIWEPITYAAPIAAEAAGAAHARFMWGLDVFTRMRRHYVRVRDEQPAYDRRDPMQEWLTARAGYFGGRFSEELVTGRFTIDYMPAPLRLDLGLHTVPIRYVPYNGASVIPEWLREPAGRPRVCLTLGTAASERLDGYFVPVGELLESVAELDVEVVATLSDRQQAELGPVPDNVRLVTFVPLHALVPTCDVVIHHGGGGSYCTSLLNGVPQLILPNLFDAPARAANLAGQGAGLTLPSHEATGAKVRDLVARLLEEPAFGKEAARLREEMLSQPTPNELVPELERLAEVYRS
ncbi:activator-dependent family glycosyltransferase [Nonomuraea sp. 10N515B]|uniref:activator-dependent family glycosyltransferase n=1 Tax=Nonomuraea sp. 10N515B TaxID=3457422 RepID=UPI003FCC7506